MRKIIEPPTDIHVKTRMDILVLMLKPSFDWNLWMDGPRNLLFRSHWRKRSELLLKKYKAAMAKGKVGRIGRIAPTIPIPENKNPKRMKIVRFIEKKFIGNPPASQEFDSVWFAAIKITCIIQKKLTSLDGTCLEMK